MFSSTLHVLRLFQWGDTALWILYPSMIHYTDRLSLTCELMMRMVVLFPTSLSYPSVGAALNRKTASCVSERQTTDEVTLGG